MQVDEPALVTELDARWQAAYASAYDTLQHSGAKLLLATYFGRLEDNLALACALVAGGADPAAWKAELLAAAGRPVRLGQHERDRETGIDQGAQR